MSSQAQNPPIVSSEGMLIQALNYWLSMPFHSDTGYLPGGMLESGPDHVGRHVSRLTLKYGANQTATDFTLAMAWHRSCSARPNAKIGDADMTTGHAYLDIRLQAVQRREHMDAARDLQSLTMRTLRGYTAHLRFLSDGSLCVPTMEPIGFKDQVAPDDLALTWRWTPEAHLVTPDMHILL